MVVVKILSCIPHAGGVILNGTSISTKCYSVPHAGGRYAAAGVSCILDRIVSLFGWGNTG